MKRLWALAISVCVLLGSVASAARTDLAVRYGEQFHRVPTAVSLQVVAATLDPLSAADVAALRAEVEQLEREQGPYAAALDEPLSALARSWQASGEHGKAAALYRRAIHIQRINNGLSTQLQMELLRSLIASYTALGDLGSLDDSYGYYYRLAASSGSLSPQHIEVALAYFRWQRAIINSDTSRRSLPRLLSLYDENEALLVAAGKATSAPEQDYRALVFSQLHNIYLLESARVQEPIIVDVGPRGFYQARRGPSPLFDELDAVQQRILGLQRTALGRGERLLLDLQQRYAGEPALQQADICLELGDWLQWHGITRRAEENYQCAERWLDSAGGKAAEAKRVQWFAEPQELPRDGVFAAASKPAELKWQTVTASYTVSKTGATSKVSTQVEVGERGARSLRRLLSGTRFRPARQDGAAISFAVKNRRYFLRK